MTNSVKWLIPKEVLSKESQVKFSEVIQEKDFDDINNLMMNLLHFVCKRRIIKDQDFDLLYQDLTLTFPKHKAQVK